MIFNISSTEICAQVGAMAVKALINSLFIGQATQFIVTSVGIKSQLAITTFSISTSYSLDQYTSSAGQKTIELLAGYKFNSVSSTVNYTKNSADESNFTHYALLSATILTQAVVVNYLKIMPTFYIIKKSSVASAGWLMSQVRKKITCNDCDKINHDTEVVVKNDSEVETDHFEINVCSGEDGVYFNNTLTISH